jgi:hypothetical protein
VSGIIAATRALNRSGVQALEEREDCPCYPTMRLFRQQQLGDWDGLFERVAEGLSGVVCDERPKTIPPAKAGTPARPAKAGTPTARFCDPGSGFFSASQPPPADQLTAKWTLPRQKIPKNFRRTY